MLLSLRALPEVGLVERNNLQVELGYLPTYGKKSPLLLNGCNFLRLLNSLQALNFLWLPTPTVRLLSCARLGFFSTELAYITYIH